MTTKPRDYPTPEEALREIGALRRKIGRQAMNDRLFAGLAAVSEDEAARVNGTAACECHVRETSDG